VREKERIEEAEQRTWLVRSDELGQRYGEACLERAIVEAERAEVEFAVAEQLHERHELVLEALEHGIDEARHHLAVAEAKAAQEELDLAEPAAPWRHHERVRVVLLDGEDLEAADAPVGADADLELQRREPFVVAEQIGERAIRLAGLHPEPEFRERRETRLRRDEAGRHAVDDLLHELEDVELTPVGVPFPGAGGAFEQPAITAQRGVEVLETCAQLRGPRELGEDRASMHHDGVVRRRMREEVREVLRREDRLVAVDPDLETKRDELREKEIACERRRLPGRGRDLRLVERFGEDAARDAARERERDGELGVFGVDAGERRGMQQIGQNHGHLCIARRHVRSPVVPGEALHTVASRDGRLARARAVGPRLRLERSARYREKGG
jgi:hypothetical protein